MTRAGESRRVAVALTGEAPARTGAADAATVDFFDAKGIVEAIADALQVDVTFDGATVPSYLVRGRAAAILVGGRAIGSLGMLAPAIVSSAGLSANEDVYVAELDLDALDGVAIAGAADGRAASRAIRPSRATSRSSSTRPCPRKRFVALSVRLRRTRSSRCASSIGIKARACPTGASASRFASRSALSSGRSRTRKWRRR